MAVVVPAAPAEPSLQQLVVLDDEAVTLKEGSSSAQKQMLAVCKKALAGWEHVTAADVEASVCCTVQFWSSTCSRTYRIRPHCTLYLPCRLVLSALASQM
eukprot:GHRQ01036500.1.p1 GENE.GHRQ01036500.1~~GHRQ01036500.1.p1  ORF type:complete len:100 (+),score=6.79 GHRQ01036500.1:269-568(+)